MENYFEKLNNINVNEHTEEKNKLTYLSWAWAWAEVKKQFPEAIYTIYENADGLFYHTDGKTCWVKTGVTINNIEHIEYLPVMDYRNNSIPAEKVTSTDVNKAIQRSLTKACARHGLGLYIYAGEDLPEAEQDKQKPERHEQLKEETKPLEDEELVMCENCNSFIKSAINDLTGEQLTVPMILDIAARKFKKKLCWSCMCEIGKKGN